MYVDYSIELELTDTYGGRQIDNHFCYRISNTILMYVCFIVLYTVRLLCQDIPLNKFEYEKLSCTLHLFGCWNSILLAML